MEVLVSHTRSRISRLLIIALCATVAVGLITHYYKYDRSTASKALAAEQITNVASHTTVTLSAPTTQRVVAVAPATRPAAQLVMATSAAQSNSISAVTITAPVINPMADAKVKLDAGDLVGGRKILSDALVSGNLSTADQAAARQLISDANKVLLLSPKHFASDPFASFYTVKSGDRLGKIAADHCMNWEFLARINNLSDPKKLRAGQTLKIIEGPFQAVVTKSTYTIDLYLGDPGKPSSLYVTTFPVGLGLDDSTPTGVWMVEPQHKLKHPTYYSPRGEGIIDSGDPRNPLGPCWIGLTGTDGHALGKLSYGIHGTNDPTSIGHQSSLGCIRMRNEDVAVVYDILVEGKSIVTVRD
jgi:lipoprotein-anchoring transpeptidase ErfK/SrfK